MKNLDLNKNHINLRKQKQYLDHRELEDLDTIVVIYKNKHGNHVEEFERKSIEEIKDIYNNFNNTLRLDESKRIIVKMFKKELTIKLTKI